MLTFSFHSWTNMKWPWQNNDSLRFGIQKDIGYMLQIHQNLSGFPPPGRSECPHHPQKVIVRESSRIQNNQRCYNCTISDWVYADNLSDWKAFYCQSLPWGRTSPTFSTLCRGGGSGTLGPLDCHITYLVLETQHGGKTQQSFTILPSAPVTPLCLCCIFICLWQCFTPNSFHALCGGGM